MNKYRNQKTPLYGIPFDSKKEAWRYAELLDKYNRGEISDLRLQVPFELIPKQKGERTVVYIADFVYVMDGKTVVEDVKGCKTKDYVIKRKLFKLRYPEFVFCEV